MSWQGFSVACKAEWFISRHNWRSILLLLTPSLAGVIHILLIRLNNASANIRQSLGGRGGDNMDFAYGYFVDGLSTGLIITYLVFVAVAAYSFAGERDHGVLRHLTIRQSSRGAILAAKIMGLHIKVVLACVLLFVACLSTCATLWDFTAVVEDGYELISTTEIEQEIRLGLTLALLPLPACLCLGLLLSVVAHSALQAVTLGLGLTLFLDIFKGAFGQAAQYIYTRFQPSLLDTSYLKEVSRIARGFSDILIDEQVMQLNYWIPVPQAVLFLLLAFVLVKRKSL